jgi:hypothetical protein
MADQKLHALFRQSGVSAETLRNLARELKEAYDAETVAEMHLSRARDKQMKLRERFYELLGDEDAISFLAMLREQSGFMWSSIGLPRGL